MSVEWFGSDGYKESLRLLGLQADQVYEALGASNTERRGCVVGHSAKSAPGYYAYNGMLTSLSSQICGSEWHREDPMSMPLLVNRSRRVALAVSSGDSVTGQLLRKQYPRTKNPKGELTRELARLNELPAPTDVLFTVPPPPIHKLLTELSSFSFWLALVFFDKALKQIRCEVSQPIGFNAHGQVNEYRKRILLPPYQLDEGELDGDDDPNDGFGPIDVDVRRR